MYSDRPQSLPPPPGARAPCDSKPTSADEVPTATTDGASPPAAPVDLDRTQEQVVEDIDKAKKLSSGELPGLRSEDNTEFQRQSDKERAKLSSEGAPEVPGYRVLRPLGEGSYGKVWLAEDDKTGKQVAIKFFTHGTGQQWQPLQAEVMQLARLYADPGIIQLINVEPYAAPPYFIMAYAAQGSLARLLEQGPMPLSRALKIFRQVARGLAYVHARNIVHCDLKPGNVLLDARGRALLADFGQAHLSEESTPVMGTFFYMAPEQADLSKTSTDTRWDVYGMGALFYAMLTGRPPREDLQVRDELAGTAELPRRLELYREWVSTAPRPDGHRKVAGMDRSLAEIIDRCLEVDPDRRFRDAGAVIASLARRERSRRHRPVLAFGVAACMLLLIALAGFAGWAAAKAVGESEELQAERIERDAEFSARILARAVEQHLTQRVTLLEDRARKPELLEALRRADREKLHSFIEDLHADWRDNKQQYMLHWVVTNRTGDVLAHSKSEQGVYHKHNVWWRGWFTGKEDDFGKETVPQIDSVPTAQTRVSTPFLQAPKKQRMVLGISAPVRDPKDDNRIWGVLMLAEDLGAINELLAGRGDEFQGGFATVVDRKGRCLLHSDLRKFAGLKPAWGEALPDRRADCHAVHVAVDSPKPGSLTCVDRSDGRTYMASYAPITQRNADGEVVSLKPVENLHWSVLIQQDRSAALKPVTDLRGTMVRIGVLTLATVSAVIAVLGGVLLWLERRVRLGRDPLIRRGAEATSAYPSQARAGA